MYDRFKTLYKAFQVPTKNPAARAKIVVDYGGESLKLYGEPTHIMYGSADLKIPLEAVFGMNVDLVFDLHYVDQFWIGYPDEAKYLISANTLNNLLDDRDLVDRLDPNDDLKRGKRRGDRVPKRKKGLAALPGYDDIQKEVNAVIAATPDVSDSEVPF